MKIIGDYHSHTRYSDGKNNVEQMVRAAEKAGLEEYAITDHGFSTHTLHITPRRWRKQRDEILRLRDTTDMKIFIGIESNLLNYDGTCDLSPEEFEMFDIVQMGYHRTAKPWKTKQFFSFIVKNFGFLPQNIDRNTQALLNAMARYPLTIVTHPGAVMKVHAAEIAKEAKKRGMLFELNEKHNADILPYIKEVSDTGVDFVLGSDSHSTAAVAHFPKTLKMIADAGIDLSRIKGIKE